MWRLIVLGAVCAIGSAQSTNANWDRVGQLARGERIQIVPRTGSMLSGRFLEWSPTSIRISLPQSKEESLSSDAIRRVAVRRKASRWKSAAIGAAIGFGVMFAVGASSAGYITDQNNPSAGTRMGTGAGMGLFGAGIGFAIGAAVGGGRYETVYRAE